MNCVRPSLQQEHQGLVAPNTFLMDVRENLAYHFHASAGLGQIRIIRNQYWRQMALPEIFAYGDIGEKLYCNAVYDIAPVNIVTRHKRVQDILLTSKHTVHNRCGVMGQSGNSEERHQDKYLENLKVRQLTVLALVAAKIAIV